MTIDFAIGFPYGRQLCLTLTPFQWAIDWEIDGQKDWRFSYIMWF